MEIPTFVSGSVIQNVSLFELPKPEDKSEHFTKRSDKQYPYLCFEVTPIEIEKKEDLPSELQKKFSTSLTIIKKMMAIEKGVKGEDQKFQTGQKRKNYTFPIRDKFPRDFNLFSFEKNNAKFVGLTYKFRSVLSEASPVQKKRKIDL